MGGATRRARPRVAAAHVLLLACVLAPGAAGASELKPQTLEAFNRYTAARDAQFDEEVQHDPFLWADGRPKEQRISLYNQLQDGGVVIRQMELAENDKEFSVPGGMVHHWLGIVFIRGAKVADVVRLIEDYDQHSKYFAPEVARSKLLSRDGDHFLTYLRFHKKHILSVTVDTWHEAWYRRINATRTVSRSHITRAQEVENEGREDEKLRPEGDDRGFLWRMNTYWKFEEKDGGTYVQCESITLTRAIPVLLKPIIEPFVTSVPRESLMGVLTHTRTAALAAAGAAEAPKAEGRP
jgi:hypothetical protein